MNHAYCQMFRGRNLSGRRVVMLGQQTFWLIASRPSSALVLMTVYMKHPTELVPQISLTNSYSADED